MALGQRSVAMSQCPSCGAASHPGATFCHACGATLPQQGPDVPAGTSRTLALAGAPPAGYGAQIPAAPAAGPQARPIGVTIVGIVTIVFGAFTALMGLAVMLFMGALGAVLGSFLPFGEGGAAMGGFFGVLGIIIAMLMIGFAALVIVTGVGTLRGRSWAWVVMLVLMAFNGLSALAGLAQQEFGSLVTLLVSGVVIWYFFQPDVKAYFGRS